MLRYIYTHIFTLEVVHTTTKTEVDSDEKTSTEGDETIPLKLPKGYVLIPEHQVRYYP